MSQSNPITPEFKTIRLPANSYYKLAELAGLIAVIRGESVSISEIGSEAVSEMHTLLYPFFLNIIRNPQKLQEMRNTFVHGKKQLSELIKDIRVLE